MRHRTPAALVAACLLLAMTATPMLAWTQLKNNYPGNPQSCNGQPPYFCYRWPKTANNLSTTQYVYLHSSLTNANINLKPDVRDAMERWNDAPARNPFMVETTNVGVADVYVDRGNAATLCGLAAAWACATHVADGNLLYTYAEVHFSSSVDWNHTHYYDTDEADSRKVATHEFGHVEALGHTGFTAIMKQGDVQFHILKANDIDGIQAIYGAYP